MTKMMTERDIVQRLVTKHRQHTCSVCQTTGSITVREYDVIVSGQAIPKLDNYCEFCHTRTEIS